MLLNEWIGNHAADIAFDGAKGKYLALTESHDLIILDIMIPQKDGFSILENLCNENNQTPAPVPTALEEVQDRLPAWMRVPMIPWPNPFAFKSIINIMNKISFF